MRQGDKERGDKANIKERIFSYWFSPFKGEMSASGGQRGKKVKKNNHTFNKNQHPFLLR